MKKVIENVDSITDDSGNRIEEIPEVITFEIEGHPKQSFQLMMNTYKTGTRAWEVFGRIIIKNEVCTVQCRLFVNNSRKKETPFWWKKRKTLSEIKNEQYEKQIEQAEQTEEPNNE